MEKNIIDTFCEIQEHYDKEKAREVFDALKNLYYAELRNLEKQQNISKLDIVLKILDKKLAINCNNMMSESDVNKVIINNGFYAEWNLLDKFPKEAEFGNYIVLNNWEVFERMIDQRKSIDSVVRDIIEVEFVASGNGDKGLVEEIELLREEVKQKFPNGAISVEDFYIKDLVDYTLEKSVAYYCDRCLKFSPCQLRLLEEFKEDDRYAPYAEKYLKYKKASNDEDSEPRN